MAKKYPEADQISQIVNDAQNIVIIQADNPDGDSLASALALEQILGDLGKTPHLYCGIDISSYLRYLPGWDRVSNEFPPKFDASIIVDTSADSLLGQLQVSGARKWVATKPCIVLDHHDVDQTIPYATVVCNKPVVSTGELIYELATQLDWSINMEAADMLAVSIMSDSLGLVTEATSARSIAIISELVEKGVSLAKIDYERRLLMRKSPELVHYKGKLLQRIEFHRNNQIATLVIPWEEIEKYSPFYNPSVLALDDMRMAEGTDVAIAFKVYKDGKITGKIRANYGRPIAADLAKAFGGGGHVYASGFKITDGRPLSKVQADCVELAHSLLTKLLSEDPNAII
jgi:phosphoesterase RecJ-like protein